MQPLYEALRGGRANNDVEWDPEQENAGEFNKAKMALATAALRPGQ